MFKLTTGVRAAKTEPPEYAVTRFDAFEYAHYLRSRLRFILLVCAAAGLLTLAGSLMLPKQYTATAGIAIDPPRVDDPRTSVALTQVYLESLRSFEYLASSDTLFLHAIERFHLRDGGSGLSLESLKRRVLKVSKLRDTKILEIEVTLPNPRQAQEMAQFLAEQTVLLNRTTNDASDREDLEEARQQAESARVDLDRQQEAFREFSERAGLPALRSELETLTTLHRSLRQDLADSRTEAAQLSASGDLRLGPAQARVASLESQDAELAARLNARAAELVRGEARAQDLDQNVSLAQSEFEAARLRLRTLESASGRRGERLRLVDPGVVPERQSSPNVGLNVALALAAAALASVTYLTLTFRQPGHDRRPH